ncbi:MAG: hypothetical protein H0V79_07080 [Actinobacteria bacterium]|nr:hypothetical protein [Actinomycetota bacterium]
MKCCLVCFSDLGRRVGDLTDLGRLVGEVHDPRGDLEGTGSSATSTSQ